MKQYIIGLSLFFLLGTTTSCDEWLDLKPENEIILEDFWKTKTDVESVLAACYKSFSERSVIERMVVWGELRSDNMIEGRDIPGNSSMYPMHQILEGNLTANNSYADWSSFYSIINTCNVLLHYAPGVVEIDENFSRKDLELVQGEAMTLRALAYFYLVRTFRDIPLITDPSIDDTQDYSEPKSPEQDVIAFILEDLESVIRNNWVRDSYGNTNYNKGRITKSAVYALLADVYLWKEEYASCIKACEKVLEDKTLRLILDKEQIYSQIFYRGNSPESIFEIQFDENNMRNTAVFDLYCSSDNNRGFLAFPSALGRDIQSEYTGAYSPFNYRVQGQYESVNDIRSWSFINYEGGDLFSIFKYGGINAYKTEVNTISYFYRTITANWIVYRLADIMLLKAEALTQQTGEENWQEAVSLLNTIYSRSNDDGERLNPTHYTTQKAREELVLRERQRELLFEGKRWFDLARMARREHSVTNLNMFVSVKRQDSPAPLGALVMDALYMPIAKRELDANIKLEQNPFYRETNTMIGGK